MSVIDMNDDDQSAATMTLSDIHASIPLPPIIIRFYDEEGSYSQNMQKLIGNFEQCDCVIAVPLQDVLVLRSQGTVVTAPEGEYLLIPVVKSLVAVQSPFFFNLLMSGGKEAKNLESRLLAGISQRELPLIRFDLREYEEDFALTKSINPLALQFLVEYIICGNMNVDMEFFDISLDIHALSCRMEMHGLTRCIERTIKDLENRDVVVELLNNKYILENPLANRLQEACLDYVDNNVKIVLDKVTKLNGEALRLILCRDTLRIGNEGQLYKVVRDWCMYQLTQKPLLYRPDVDEYYAVSSVPDDSKEYSLSTIHADKTEKLVVSPGWGDIDLEASMSYKLAQRNFDPSPVYFKQPITANLLTSNSQYIIKHVDITTTKLDTHKVLCIEGNNDERLNHHFFTPHNEDSEHDFTARKKRGKAARSIPLNKFLYILSNGLFHYIRYPLIETSLLTSTVSVDNIVPSATIIAAMSYQLGNEGVQLPPYMKIPRTCAFSFDTVLSLADEWEFRKNGTEFRNLMTEESSITAKQPIVRQHNDKRVITFEVLFGDLDGVKKGFFGIGLMSKSLGRFKGGVTSKQNGTLYYSNGWISSFGSTLDKSGNVPPFDIGDKVGLRIDLGKSSMQFLLNGLPSGPEVTLHSAFIPVGAELFPAVRLKSHTKANIVS